MRMELKLLRIKNHKTIDDMAELCGINRMTYSLIENGRSDGKIDFWNKVQAAFGISDAEMWKVINNTEAEK